MEVPPEHREFADRVEESKAQDPMPTFARLSEVTAVPVDDLVHYALVRWAASGSEALMAIEPAALRQLAEARRREDWTAVAGIVDWLLSGQGSGGGDGTSVTARSHGSPGDGRPS